MKSGRMCVLEDDGGGRGVREGPGTDEGVSSLDPMSVVLEDLLREDLEEFGLDLTEEVAALALTDYDCAMNVDVLELWHLLDSPTAWKSEINRGSLFVEAAGGDDDASQGQDNVPERAVHSKDEENAPSDPQDRGLALESSLHRPTTTTTGHRGSDQDRSGNRSRSDRRCGAWHARIEQFIEFKTKYDIAYVDKAHRSTVSPSLANWINKNRYKLSKLALGQKVYGMTPQKLDLLNQIGFEKPKARSKSWERMFEALLMYKAIHGDCNVHTKCAEFKNLGHWVSHQRTAYKKFLAGEESSLTEERIDLLNREGFVWQKIKSGRPKARKRTSKASSCAQK